MAQRKPYNPNTKYGRRKIAESYYQLPEQERKDAENMKFGCLLVFIIVGSIFTYFLFGFDGMMRWLGGKRPY